MEKNKEKFKDFTGKKERNDEETKEYKNKVIFLRKSKAGNHLYAFDNNGAFADAIEGSIVFNIVELEGLLSGRHNFVKVSVLPKREEEIDINIPEL